MVEKNARPVLNQLIQAALANNNQVQTAQANIVQAQAKLKQAYFAWLPTVGITGSAFFAKGWDGHFTPLGPLAKRPTLTNLSNLDIHGNYRGFVPNYSLNILQNLNNTKYAKASLCTQKAIYMATRLSIISQISGSYFTLLGQKEQLKDQTTLIHHLKKLRNMEFIRYKDGASDISTVTNLDQQIANSQASLPTIENSIAQVENTIQLLINQNPGPIITKGSLNKLSIQGLIPANIPSAVLKNRPDIIIAEESLKLSDASLGIAYANFFPTISLTGLLEDHLLIWLI